MFVLFIFYLVEFMSNIYKVHYNLMVFIKFSEGESGRLTDRILYQQTWTNWTTISTCLTARKQTHNLITFCNVLLIAFCCVLQCIN